MRREWLRRRRIRVWPVALLGVVLVAGTAEGAPERAEVADQTLVLNGEGTRDRFGIPVYELGLYLPRRTSNAREIRDAERTKALRYEMLWPGPVPDGHPERWKEELLPVLTDAQAERLRENLASLGAGDVLWIYYVPGQGTTIERGEDGGVLVQDPSHDVMDAYLDLWLGEEPLSADVRDALLAGDGKRGQE